LGDGTPMYINEIVTHSDLKLAVCGIIPHDSVGFGGGCKIILPGVSGFDTIAHNHSKYKSRGRGNVDRQGEEKDMRDNIEEVARYVGLDFTVNMVLTKKRKIAGLFMGDAIESYRQGAIFAKNIYDTVIAKENIEATDIVIVNAYPQDSDAAQMGKSMWPFGVFKNAQKIVINQASDGINYHGLSHKMDYDSFLKMKANEPEPNNIPENAEIKSKGDFVLLSSNYPKGDFYRHYPNGALFDNWEDLIVQLKQFYHKPKVAVIPYSSLQLPHLL
jgi:lactate racemase